MADLPKPVAQVQRMGSYQGVPAYGCLLTIEAQKRLKVNDPLFSLAELDAYAAAKVAEERAVAVRVLSDVLEASKAQRLHASREEDARTLLRLARERAAIRGTEAQNDKGKRPA